MIIYKIGRNPDNDIVINDQSQRVSRCHAVLSLYDNGSVKIFDLSTNGTYVNGVKIKPQFETIVTRSDIVVFANKAQLDWSVIPKVSNNEPRNLDPQSHKPISEASHQKITSENNSPMRIIGWILIGLGFIGIFKTGISFTFEGICAVSAPIIGGIILILRAKKQS